MPPKNRFTKEEIVRAGLTIARREGISAVTARSVASELGSSSKVIFGIFENMDGLHRDIAEAALTLYNEHISTAMKSGEYPPYKASGMAYIGFAADEPELFKLLFMCDRKGETVHLDTPEIEIIITMLMREWGLTREEAIAYHMEMWIFVHGVAVMTATNYLKLDTEHISSMLSDIYHGRLLLLKQQKEMNKCTPSVQKDSQNSTKA